MLYYLNVKNYYSKYTIKQFLKLESIYSCPMQYRALHAQDQSYS